MLRKKPRSTLQDWVTDDSFLGAPGDRMTLASGASERPCPVIDRELQRMAHFSNRCTCEAEKQQQQRQQQQQQKQQQ
jgi:hypothetical protein